MKTPKQYKTVIISDVHLGSEGSKAKEVTAFLKSISCETLIMNGDIIDGWQLKKGGSWKKKHTAFFRAVLKMIENHNTKVIYLRGNHDDFLDQIIPFQLGKYFTVQRDYILQSGTKSYLITHGDIFDSVTSQMKWLAYLGDIGYTFLLSINKLYNQYRKWRGFEYYSFSQRIKQRVKEAVNYVSDFEEKLTELARANHCEGIICGHIHKPDIRLIQDITYMNSGDWVESLTALVEDYQGNWDLLYLLQNSLDLEEELSDELIDSEAMKTAKGIFMSIS
ncbi:MULTISPECIES: UDP-2,3-diacylglucosamine diphosphatase [Arcicella]|uniref:UDP-2,3-diacylglucosamine diphosphatase n=1 Tax=Arcicella aquatica TaxID=217141 RepID=A0ABU5QRG4_9BACT|nr:MULTISPECIES: UDP-2,3-diacylglucosamine diphosphatase [Arcicella]MDR6561535.1 UDP-2,3-diacylglucosamine pyrophosphatase LpxH [Arcicella sp. BE51]MDR6811419.1 UDP-2,3-diacylglucosamine pyrophosphatase LpxH [Arcicella sp. BE140]MDR6822769.1 UDP-2,3-diacylglucosamine pyrophosphatase LpxH [Arcicella sp. BE139]MEA5259673.1 UDP-2,3-diacylglucosamine diphosphatase [Arcicella aquatica]